MGRNNQLASFHRSNINEGDPKSQYICHEEQKEKEKKLLSGGMIIKKQYSGLLLNRQYSQDFIKKFSFNYPKLNEINSNTDLEKFEDKKNLFDGNFNKSYFLLFI